MPKRPIRPEDLLQLTVPSDPRLSPDGSSAVYTVKRIASKNKYATDLFLWNGELRQLTEGDSNNTQPRWKPDGTAVAFVSDRNKPLPSLMLMPMQGGEPRKILDLPEGSFAKYEWSPDGKHIAFLFREKAQDRTEKAKEQRKETGESEPPLVVETLIWRMDGDGVFGDDRFALYVVNVDSGEWRPLVTAAKSGDYSFCWLDADSLAVSYNPSERPTMEPWQHDVFVVRLDGSCRKLEGLPVGPKSSLTSLGDGWIAVSFNDRTVDRFGYKAGRLCYLNVSTGAWEDPWQGRPELDLNVWTLSDIKEPGYGARLTTSGPRLFGELSREGSTHIVEFLRDGTILPLTDLPGDHTLGSVADETMAIVRMSVSELPEIEILRSGERVFRSEHNARLNEELEFLAGEEHWIESEPGVRVQTWVIRPTVEGRLPAVIEVHGGPHGMYSCSVFLEMQVLAAAGYVVAWSNPRGSTGYGEEFARCITGDWGNKDWLDVQAVTTLVKSLDFVDPARVAIMGGSYGGYMVNWAIGHSDGYKCAITDRCVANLLSKSGNSDYTFVPDGNWPGSAFNGDWEVLWDRSPVKHFSNVSTPTLVIHSEGDLRCHVEQGEQVYTFLKMKGVPTRLVRYPANTSHGMSRSGPPDLRVHRLREQLDWYAKYL